MNQNKKLQSDVRTDWNAPPTTPPWVKVFGIIIVILIVLFMGLQFLGGGRHGPGRHLPSSNTPTLENSGQ
jgi:hypothetical protein